MIPFLLACSIFSAVTGAVSLFRPSRKAAPLHGYAEDPFDPHVHWFDEFDDPEMIFICRDHAEACFEAPSAQRFHSAAKPQP